MRLFLLATAVVCAAMAFTIGVGWRDVGAGDHLRLTMAWTAASVGCYVAADLWIAFGDWWRGHVR